MRKKSHAAQINLRGKAPCWRASLKSLHAFVIFLTNIAELAQLTVQREWETVTTAAILLRHQNRNNS